jgi:outer membrane receptor protein involved in Fe transport
MRLLALSLRAAFVGAVLFYSAATEISAQQILGRVTGQVMDAQTGRSLPGAQVLIEGTERGALAGLEGRFVITNVQPGTLVIRAVMLGYAPKTLTGVTLTVGQTVQVDITLDAAAIALEGITVSAQAERGSVAAALNEQRTAVGVVSGITAEEISRTPDGDAAAAARRVSGVTIDDGKFPRVRGLGERYTTASLNGARIPSPEPERKMVPLDMFASGILQSITTSKTFTPNLPGDFSGAQIDIRTRTFPAQPQVSFSASTGFNLGVTGKSILVAPGTGREWLALAAADRPVPEVVESFGNFIQRVPTQGDINSMVRSFRNAWSTRSESARPNSSFSATLGGSSPLAGLSFGYLVTGSYGYSEEAKVDQVRAQALAQSGAEATEVDRFEGSTGSSSAQWGGLANFSALWGSHSRFLINSVYNRAADHEARSEVGFSENLASQFRIERLRYVERSMLSAQLAGEHQINDSHRLDWAFTNSAVSRVEPDRSEIVYQLEPRQAPRWFNASNEGAVRTFGDLDEMSMEGSADYRFSFGAASRSHEIRLGALARMTDRDATNQAFAIGATLSEAGRALSPEQIFDGRFSQASSSVFRITPLSQGGSYSAEDRLGAGYLMLDLGLSESLRLVTGARVEHSDLSLRAQSTLGTPVRTSPQYTDVLPSVSLNYKATETQTLRLSASQTLARPEYREIANVQYREVLGGDNVLGNPDLRRTLIRNLDLRWEWYPGPAEALSVAFFGKSFKDPVERVYLATSGTRIITFQNAEGAHNYGLELELRKDLVSLAKALSPFSIFSNLTLMESKITIGEGSSRTRDERPMVGQSRYVVNTGLTFAPASGRVSSTVLYNVAGKRISSAGEMPLPDVFELPRHMLDLSVRFSLWGGLSGEADFKNLLDAPYEFRQGSVLREYYRSGRAISLGLNWRPTD